MDQLEEREPEFVDSRSVAPIPIARKNHPLLERKRRGGTPCDPNSLD